MLLLAAPHYITPESVVLTLWLAMFQDDGVAGPNSEHEWWKSRLSRLSHIKLQLKGHAAKATVGICLATRSKTSKRWHDVEFKVSVFLDSQRQCWKYGKLLLKSSLCPKLSQTEQLPY
jgi:hypothetical protein